MGTLARWGQLSCCALVLVGLSTPVQSRQASVGIGPVGRQVRDEFKKLKAQSEGLVGQVKLRAGGEQQGPIAEWSRRCRDDYDASSGAFNRWLDSFCGLLDRGDTTPRGAWRDTEATFKEAAKLMEAFSSRVAEDPSCSSALAAQFGVIDTIRELLRILGVDLGGFGGGRRMRRDFAIEMKALKLRSWTDIPAGSN